MMSMEMVNVPIPSIPCGVGVEVKVEMFRAIEPIPSKGIKKENEGE